jgi:hypothetical protein
VRRCYNIFTSLTFNTAFHSNIPPDGATNTELEPLFGSDTIILNLPNAHGRSHPPTLLEKLLAVPAIPVSLALLKEDFNEENGACALTRLSRPMIIDFEDEIVDPIDPSLLFGTGLHYLDSLCVVGSMGFSAIIPNEHVTGFQFRINPKHFSTATFMDKHSFLPWDLTNRAVLLGEVAGGQVWVILRPMGDGDDLVGEPVVSPGSLRTSTIMTKVKLRVLLVFLCIALSEMDIGIICDFTIAMIQRMIEPAVRTQMLLDDEIFNTHCNMYVQTFPLMNNSLTYWPLRIGRLTLKPKALNQAQLDELDTFVVSGWVAFRDVAFSDLFRTEVPHVVLSKYGQNLPFCEPASGPSNIRYLEHIVSLHNSLFVSYALATEIPCTQQTQQRRQECGQLTNLEHIHKQYPTRSQKPYSRYPTQDDTLHGFVLGEHGRNGIEGFHNRQYRSGARPKEDIDADIDMERAIHDCLHHIHKEGHSFSMYPHAFTKIAGAFQSKGLPQFFKPCLVDMETALGIEHFPTAIFGGCYQEYSALSHNTRPTTGESDLVQGTLGAWAVGKCLNGSAAYRKKVDKLDDQIRHRMPLDQYQRRVDGSMKLGIRKEPTIIISIQDLPEAKRNWTYVT